MQMTKTEAKEQLETFFEKLGDKNSSILEEKNFVKASFGDAIIGFVLNDEDTLSCQSLVYRFRKPPREAILAAIDEESRDAPNGGGEIAFDESNFTLVLQKEYKAAVPADEFFGDMQELVEASLEWSNSVLSRVAEKAIPVS